MSAENPPKSPVTGLLPADQEPADKVWRIAGMSPAAIEAARAAARRAGVPLAVWLAGLIHHVADAQEGGE